MKQSYNKTALAFVFAALLVLASASFSSACAQTAVATQNLSFGTFAITDFGTIGRITINTNGSYNRAGSIYVIDPPQRGEYAVSNAGMPNSAFTVTVSPASTTLTGLSNPLTVDDFTISPASPMTDGAGNETVYIGARLSTSGGGTTHAEGVHTGNFDFIMNF